MYKNFYITFVLIVLISPLLSIKAALKQQHLMEVEGILVNGDFSRNGLGPRRDWIITRNLFGW
jgi:hypothetical protein